MSLSLEQLEEHCHYILQSRRIKNKIVVLCEGNIEKIEGRPSPQSYGKMEQMPDANFYKACVPRYWKGDEPQFFNCGDRTDVINTYFYLLELHNQDSNKSYLNPNLLFAIVDLDIQIKIIDNYNYTDTETIFYDLYEQFKVKPTAVSNHRIWVTGLTHKEAYFLIPELQEVFNNYLNSPIYKQNLINLDDLYIDMAEGIINDLDLKANFPKISNRIRCCSVLDCSKLAKLQQSWKAKFKNSKDSQKYELIMALMTFIKAKKYWNEVQPPEDYSRSPEIFREQLSLEIGRKFYQQYDDHVQYHISFFLKTLYDYYINYLENC